MGGEGGEGGEGRGEDKEFCLNALSAQNTALRLCCK